MEYPVFYVSQKPQQKEENYLMFEHEALAIVQKIKHFLTIHREPGLFSLMNSNGRLARWAQTLHSYKFVVEQRARTANVNTDGQSQELLCLPTKGMGMSEIKYNPDNKTPMTGVATNFQQELLITPKKSI